MLALTLAGLLVMILSLPINDSTRGQLLSLLGIVLKRDKRRRAGEPGSGA